MSLAPTVWLNISNQRNVGRKSNGVNERQRETPATGKQTMEPEMTLSVMMTLHVGQKRRTTNVPVGKEKQNERGKKKSFGHDFVAGGATHVRVIDVDRRK